MHFTPAIAAVILAFAATNVLAAPLPQLAGEGAACDSIFSSTDNGVGYGIENAEDNMANSMRRRQLAGEGAACNSILSSTDNGVGYGIENAENNIANNISGAKGTTGGATGGATGGKAGGNPPPPPPPHRRQLDKIANGAQAIGEAMGMGSATSPVTTAGDNIDGELTSGAASLGAQMGSTEEGTLEGAGAAVPKSRRQLDKIAHGMQAIGSAAGMGSLTESGTNGLVNLDGTMTGAAADMGAEIGSAEEGTLEAAGSSVP